MRTLYPVMRVLCRQIIAPIPRSGTSGRRLPGKMRSCAIGVLSAVLGATSCAQTQSQTSARPGSPSANTQLPVNWLYGAYVPKDVPLVALNGQERFKLYIRQTYTTPGIYIKTGFFALHDQVRDTPPAWGD